MNTVTQYVQKFLSESRKMENESPVAQELDKIRDSIDLDEGSEFSITVRFNGIAGETVDPSSGAYSYTEVNDTIDGFLSITKEENAWQWESSVYVDSLYDFDLNGSGKGFESLEDCLTSVAEWAEDFEEFTVNEKVM